MNVIPLTPPDLAIAASLVLALGVATTLLRLKVAAPLLIAATRMIVQLLLVGFVLERLFGVKSPAWVLLMAVIMLLIAGREVVARQSRRLKSGWSFAVGSSAMMISSFTVTILALTTIIQVEPWHTPQYAIPILGMMLGNTMTGISLACDRLIQMTSDRRDVIEARLLGGETRWQAILDTVRESLRAGLVPTINSMAAAGIVSLPGMMTGQILSGSPPAEAVKYQILIWLLITAGTGSGMIVAVGITARRLFDDRHRLRLDRLTAE